MAKAAIVAISDPEKETVRICEMEEKGYIVHVPFEDAPDRLAAECLRRELSPAYDEVVLVCT